MTRYCAAQFCRNRGSHGLWKQRRVSFYPFPLRDKNRLQEWLENMKQSSWYPKKHQVLCSDHFTRDCFDIRWGIRYLKPNAVPTIFPCPSSCRDPFYSTQNISENIRRSDCCKAEEKSSESVDFSQAETSWLLTSLLNGEHALIEQSIQLPCQHSPKGLDMTSCQNISCESNHGSVRPERNMAHPSTSIVTHPREQGDDQAKIACNIQVERFRDLQITIQESAQPNTIALTSPDESVIAIVLPEERSDRPQSVMESLVLDDHRYTSVQQLVSGNLVCLEAEAANVTLENEHSYCRPGSNRALLWEKITKLKSKVALLEIQENATLSRLHSLETLIKRLKQENLLSGDKLKIVESCFNNCDIAALQ
uniref:THAP domain-containing protein 5 n=1 Tax=Leptobrachium leishanense TaxID=445787 RepID=A0A8C5M997_9ANUR